MTGLQLALLVIYRILYVYYFLLIATFLLGLTPIMQTGFHRFLRKITDPYMNIFSGWIVIKWLDFTPVIGLLFFQFVLFLIGRAL